MIEYPKIETIWNRSTITKTVIPGEWRLPEFEYLKNNEWIGTEKVDGTNVRVGWNYAETTLLFGGRTDAAQIPAHLVNKLNELFQADKFKVFYTDINMVLYGEGFGAKIQKGGGLYRPNEVDFILFDVLIGNLWLKRESVEDVAQKLEINVVPIVAKGTLDVLADKIMDGLPSVVAKEPRLAEGLVIRPIVDLLTRRGQRVIGKIKTRDFKCQNAR